MSAPDLLQHEATLAEFTSKLRAFRPTATVLEAEIARVRLVVIWGGKQVGASIVRVGEELGWEAGGGGRKTIVRVGEGEEGG